MYSHIRDVSFTLKQGEVLGIAGLDGSGRTEVSGKYLRHRHEKERYHQASWQSRFSISNASESIKNKFALLTEERRATGIFGILDIKENTTISSLPKYKKMALLLDDKSKMREDDGLVDQGHADQNAEPADKDPFPLRRQPAEGNSWKMASYGAGGVFFSTSRREASTSAPSTRFTSLFMDLAGQGKGVIMVSSEMPELLGVCDRILVMSGGRLAGEVDAKSTTQEEIMTLAAMYA